MEMTKIDLKKAYDQGLINIDKYKDELFKLETTPKKTKRHNRIYEAVPAEIFIKILNKTTKIHHKISFILAYGSGLRISEITSLEKDDFDFKQRKIFIRQAKGKKDRMTLLSKYFKQEFIKKIPIKIGERAIGKAFLNKIKPYNKEIYVDAAGRPRYRYHFHSLRHSFAVNCLNEGIPAHVLQSMLGHSDLKTTSKYTHISGADAIAEAIARGL